MIEPARAPGVSGGRAILASTVLLVGVLAGCTGSSGSTHAKPGTCGLTKGSVTPPEVVTDRTTAVADETGVPATDSQYAAADDAVRVFPVADVGAYYVTDRGVGLLSTDGRVKWSWRGKVTDAVAADRSLVVQTGTSIATIGLARGAVVSCVKDGSALISATQLYLGQSPGGPDGLPVDADRMSRLSYTSTAGQHTTVVEQLTLPESADDTAASSFAAIGGAFGQWQLVGAVDGFSVLGGYQTLAGQAVDAYVQLAFVGRPELPAGNGPGPDVSKSQSGADIDIVRLTAPVAAVPAGTTWLGEKVRGVTPTGTVVMQDAYRGANDLIRFGAVAAYSSHGTRLWTASGVQEVAVSGSGVLDVSAAYGSLTLTERDEKSGKVTARTKLPAAHADPTQPVELYGQSSQVWVVNRDAIAYVFTGDGKLQHSTSFELPSGAELRDFELGEGSSAAAVTVVADKRRSISIIDGT